MDEAKNGEKIVDDKSNEKELGCWKPCPRLENAEKNQRKSRSFSIWSRFPEELDVLKEAQASLLAPFKLIAQWMRTKTWSNYTKATMRTQNASKSDHFARPAFAQWTGAIHAPDYSRRVCAPHYPVNHSCFHQFALTAWKRCEYIKTAPKTPIQAPSTAVPVIVAICVSECVSPLFKRLILPNVLYIRHDHRLFVERSPLCSYSLSARA